MELVKFIDEHGKERYLNHYHVVMIEILGQKSFGGSGHNPLVVAEVRVCTTSGRNFVTTVDDLDTFLAGFGNVHSTD